MRRLRVDPVRAVLIFVVAGTALVYGIVRLAGPGVPADTVVLLAVAAPVVVALVFGWFLASTAEE